jgi:hypothetical protein
VVENFDKLDITMCCKDGKYKNETAPIEDELQLQH